MQLPDFNVEGQVALFTGAGRGIGLAMARALAAGGAAVAIQDIDEGVAKAEADAINAAGGRAIALGGDLGDLAVPDRVFSRTVEALGKVSILVNNASIQHMDKFPDHPIDRMRRELDVNVIAATRLCQLALPPMQEAKWGRVINMGSIQGRNGFPGMPAYAMSRAAMENLTRGLARRFSRDGITFNCVAPGWFDTWRNRQDLDASEGRRQEAGNHIPVGRIGRPDDCAGLCLLLCSPSGEYITGQTIYVDGGMTC